MTCMLALNKINKIKQYTMPLPDKMTKPFTVY